MMLLMGVMRRWRMELSEVMDQVWARNRQEREKHHQGSKRTQAHTCCAQALSPWPAVGPACLSMERSQPGADRQCPSSPRSITLLATESSTSLASQQEL